MPAPFFRADGAGYPIVAPGVRGVRDRRQRIGEQNRVRAARTAPGSVASCTRAEKAEITEPLSARLSRRARGVIS
ncbi:MAG TPA: hypothetical protein VHJ18_00055 [Streptosporangiaceae bacterium]|nr:hypothetical protein [Streptosporangiaceae bacterium]